MRPSNVDKKSKPDERAVRLVNYTDVYYHQVITTDLELMMATASDEHIDRFGVLPDDIIITKDSETPDDIGIPAQVGSADDDMVCAYHLTLLRPWRDRAFPRYIYWVLESSSTKDYWLTSSFGVTRYSIGSGVVSRLPVVNVDLDTQRAIADYLDRETGEIDAMIAKLDELAETLDLRRAEAVSSAISGLGRNDRIATANTWFPDIPQGWKLTSVQLLSELLTDGAHVSPETENGEFDFVSTKDVRNGIIDFAGSLKTSARSYASMVQTGCKPLDGDVLYSKDGTIGETVLVYGSHDFVVASSLIIIRARRDLVAPRYLQYALESTPARKAARSYTRGTGLPRISVANLGRGVTVPLPPTLDEQHRIADHLDEVTGKIDAMLAKVAELKSLLIERRAALITDVVTGRKAVA